jgi:hypothetical protein
MRPGRSIRSRHRSALANARCFGLTAPAAVAMARPVVKCARDEPAQHHNAIDLSARASVGQFRGSGPSPVGSPSRAAVGAREVRAPGAPSRSLKAVTVSVAAAAASDGRRSFSSRV